MDVLALRRLDMSGRPAFRLRDIYRAFNDSNLSIFAVHKRLNGKGGLGSYFGPEYGGAIRYGSPNHCHTFDLYIPNAEYFKEHPEWFSYDAREGRRVSGVFGQLCLTNPELREEMKRRLKGFIEADIRKFKKIGLEPPSLYDISENDNWNYCACTNCVAAKERWNMSGLMLDFVNDIASSVKDQYPHVLIMLWSGCVIPNRIWRPGCLKRGILVFASSLPIGRRPQRIFQYGIMLLPILGN